MAVRRLPVIQQASGEDAEAAARPALHWVLIGSGLLVTIWAPGIGIALWLSHALTRAGQAAGLMDALLVSATLVAAALAAGYLIGRFGTATRPRHAAWAGAAAAAELVLLALLGGALDSAGLAVSAFLSLALLAAGFSALGSWLQRRSRHAPAGLSPR